MITLEKGTIYLDWEAWKGLTKERCLTRGEGEATEGQLRVQRRQESGTLGCVKECAVKYRLH